jgi:hypothetical protein
MNLDLTNLSLIATIIPGIGALYVMVRKVLSNIEKSRKRHAAAIIQVAKDNDIAIKLSLESRIHDLELKVQTVEENIEKDVAHLKETYNNEIKFLGQKIESLRQEVHDQHGQLVALLTKMIGRD